METTQYMNEGELRVLAGTYDSVYLHPVWRELWGQGVAASLGYLPYPCQPHCGNEKLNE